MFLASADATDVAAVEALLRTARDGRLAMERQNAAPPAVLGAWTLWYQQAIASASRLSGR